MALINKKQILVVLGIAALLGVVAGALSPFASDDELFGHYLICGVLIATFLTI